MNIEILYPEVANLYGDLMNVEYLCRSCPNAEKIETPLFEKPRFLSEEIALVYLASMTEQGQELCVKSLLPYRSELEKKIEAGQLFLATGNALEVFGERIDADDGRSFACLGLFGTHAEQHMMSRYNALYLGSFEGTELIGFKSQFGHSYGESGCEPLFSTLRGDGLCPGEAGEGFRRCNFLATYVLGPVVILNPPFAEFLLKKMGVEKPELAFSEAAYDVYRHRVEEFRNPETGFKY